jgi:hypothetical protein
MHIESQIVSRFEGGIVLDIIADDLPLRAYVAIREPDPEVVTGFVPPEQFEEGGNLHVAAIMTPEDAAGMIEDVLFNMDPGDAVALLCADTACWLAAIGQLGHAPDGTSLE